MKLYRWPKTRSFRAVCMLEVAGCKVPVLVDGEARVAESAAICAYVAERVPQTGLAPALGYPARGRHLQWLLVQRGRRHKRHRSPFRHRAVQDRRCGAGVSRLRRYRDRPAMQSAMEIDAAPP